LRWWILVRTSNGSPPASNADRIVVVTRGVGIGLVVVALLAALAAPVLAPHEVDDHFGGLLNAPPTWPHVIDQDGGWHAPFIYPWRITNQLEQTYAQDRSTRVPLAWLSGGRLVGSTSDTRAPFLLLGGDTYGRDVFSRLLYGARTSLGVAAAAAIGAMLVGLFIGGLAGYAGGALDEALMRGTDFVLVLPAMYVVLALRSVLPPVLAARTVFLLLAAIFAIVGAPFIARGVRAIVRSERQLDYAVAARALGASDFRLLAHHLLPAARGFIVVEITMLVPAFIVAEATLSYVGLGFPEPVASWGSMLHEASSVRVFADFPWLLSPAVAMFLVVLGLNLALQDRRPQGLRYERPL
jgi:peptide/nickel transport system permease protein